jgi:hypothetical protein
MSMTTHRQAWLQIEVVELIGGLADDATRGMRACASAPRRALIWSERKWMPVAVNSRLHGVIVATGSKSTINHKQTAAACC